MSLALFAEIKEIEKSHKCQQNLNLNEQKLAISDYASI